MLFKSTFFVGLLVSNAIAHTSMGFPRPRSHPLNPNAVNIDFECVMAPLNGAPNGDGCPATPFPCKGYPRDSRITQTLTAGQLVPVEFYNQNFPNGGVSGQEGADQARHSGGLCQFSLSVDGGDKFIVIAEYTRGCPDIYFKFPVRIPNDIPSSDSAIFAWTWINASGNREFYMNCADVKLVGVAGGKLSGKEITKANLPGRNGFETTLTPKADVNPLSNSKGPGPSSEEVAKNSAQKGSSLDNPSPENTTTTTKKATTTTKKATTTTTITKATTTTDSIEESPSPEQEAADDSEDDDSTPGIDEDATPAYGDYTVQSTSTTRRKKCKVIEA